MNQRAEHSVNIRTFMKQEEQRKILLEEQKKEQTKKEKQNFDRKNFFYQKLKETSELE